jgi:hypothetical protein
MVILPGSAAHKKLVENVTRPRLIAAIRKLSSFHQTSGLGAKHALDNLFTCKNTYFPYHSLTAWLVKYSVVVYINIHII